MKTYTLLAIGILFLPLGCASRHYCRVEEDAVRICLRKPDAGRIRVPGFDPQKGRRALPDRIGARLRASSIAGRIEAGG